MQGLTEKRKGDLEGAENARKSVDAYLDTVTGTNEVTKEQIKVETNKSTNQLKNVSTNVLSNELNKIERKRFATDLNVNIQKELKIYASLTNQNLYELVEDILQEFIDRKKKKGEWFTIDR